MKLGQDLSNLGHKANKAKAWTVLVIVWDIKHGICAENYKSLSYSWINLAEQQVPWSLFKTLHTFSFYPHFLQYTKQFLLRCYVPKFEPEK